jgi:hypothetical protein
LSHLQQGPGRGRGRTQRTCERTAKTGRLLGLEVSSTTLDVAVVFAGVPPLSSILCCQDTVPCVEELVAVGLIPPPDPTSPPPPLSPNPALATPDGTVHLRQRERIYFSSLITLKPTGGTAKVKVRLLTAVPRQITSRHFTTQRNATQHRLKGGHTHTADLVEEWSYPLRAVIPAPFPAVTGWSRFCAIRQAARPG